MQEGQGVSWLKLGRVRKLMEDENYRNFVVSRLNKNLDKKLADDCQHIEDVVCLLYAPSSESSQDSPVKGPKITISNIYLSTGVNLVR